MNVRQEMHAIREELKAFIREELSSMVKLLPYSKSTADGAIDKVQGYPTAGTDEQAYDFDGRRVQPFGHRSVPPKGTLGAWVGYHGKGLILGAESSQFGPSDLGDGETALYNKVTGCLVKLKSDGSVNISDKGGATITLDGSGNVTAQAAAPNGTVTVTATPVTGSVKLGPVGNLAVLVQGAFDSMGVPITQAPAALLSIVKAG